MVSSRARCHRARVDTIPHPCIDTSGLVSAHYRRAQTGAHVQARVDPPRFWRTHSPAHRTNWRQPLAMHSVLERHSGNGSLSRESSYEPESGRENSTDPVSPWRGPSTVYVACRHRSKGVLTGLSEWPLAPPKARPTSRIAQHSQSRHRTAHRSHKRTAAPNGVACEDEQHLEPCCRPPAVEMVQDRPGQTNSPAEHDWRSDTS